ncbi:MAG: TRAP transporter large permease subunit, partial [Rhodobacteraceae bacterium]|nr:TRAP transporter large permease subunit [Paracoccaceae bacterium]
MIHELAPVAVFLFVLFLLLGSGVWIGLALLGVAFVGMELFTTRPAGDAMMTTIWRSASSWSLTALPLFIWMGEILTRSRMSEDLFTGLAPWMRRIPGRLIHINILGSGIFAAVAGSSAATCATVGRMSIPELRRRGYDDKLIFGTLAASSTLGLLIPPSIIMIVYGVATEQSVARLFIAGILPGLMLIALFMGYIVVRALLNPGLVPAAEPRMPLREKLRQSRRLLPVFALIVCVVGAIYGGLASPTDAAAVGVGFSLLIVYLSGDWEWKVIKAGLISASYTTCMIGLIVVTANFLTAAMGFVGLPRN